MPYIDDIKAKLGIIKERKPETAEIVDSLLRASPESDFLMEALNGLLERGFNAGYRDGRAYKPMPELENRFAEGELNEARRAEFAYVESPRYEPGKVAVEKLLIMEWILTDPAKRVVIEVLAADIERTARLFGPTPVQPEGSFHAGSLSEYFIRGVHLEEKREHIGEICSLLEKRFDLDQRRNAERGLSERALLWQRGVFSLMSAEEKTLGVLLSVPELVADLSTDRTAGISLEILGGSHPDKLRALLTPDVIKTFRDSSEEVRDAIKSTLRTDPGKDRATIEAYRVLGVLAPSPETGPGKAEPAAGKAEERVRS